MQLQWVPEPMLVNKLYVLHCMDPVLVKHPYKNFQTYTPGPTGTVGVPLTSIKLKHSNPDMPLRWDKTFSGKNSPLHGSNIQNGYSYSFTSGGGPARMDYEANFNRRSFKTDHGWEYQDLRKPDVKHETIMGSTGRYSYNNKIATLYEAKRTGNMFLPLPGAYGPKGLTRGNQVPRVMSSSATSLPLMVSQIKQPVVNQDGTVTWVWCSTTGRWEPRDNNTMDTS